MLQVLTFSKRFCMDSYTMEVLQSWKHIYCFKKTNITRFSKHSRQVHCKKSKKKLSILDLYKNNCISVPKFILL